MTGASRISEQRGWRRLPVAATLAALMLLGACGGGGTESATASSSSGSSAAAPVDNTPARGTLLQDPPSLSANITAADLQLQLNTAANQQLLGLSGAPVCNFAVYHLGYNTVGARNEATTASAALMVPFGTEARCRGPRPIVLYAHGTTTNKAFDIGDLQDAQNAEGLLLAALFASQGYIVVAPNYAGYDTSTLTYSAYLNADQQSRDMIDAVSAARSALPAAGLRLITDNGRLFVTGYSQGGYVAMATQRAMQAAGMTVTAAAPMSGPYALAAFVDAVFSGQVDGGAPVFVSLLIAGYQKAYGNLYGSPAEVFEAPYATGIESLLPTTTTRGELYNLRKLPQYALFSSIPPDAASASITPATQPAAFAPVFALGFGSGNLITNSYRENYLLDARAAPDGGWPTVTTGIPTASAKNGLRQALVRNDLRNWSPSAPTLLCGGSNDPLVFWLNTQLMQSYWASRASPPTGVTVLDLEAAATAADPYSSLKSGFAVAKKAVATVAIAQGATDGGGTAVFESYHTTLVAPFCLAAVRAFFASQ